MGTRHPADALHSQLQYGGVRRLIGHRKERRERQVLEGALHLLGARQQGERQLA
jgi:hypothetical protein